MKRRDFLTKGSVVAAALVADKARASTTNTRHENLVPNEHVHLKAGKVYVLPDDQAVPISTLITCSYDGQTESGPIIFSKGSKIQGHEKELTVDMQGTFRLQYLGPDLGWSVS